MIISALFDNFGTKLARLSLFMQIVEDGASILNKTYDDEFPGLSNRFQQNVDKFVHEYFRGSMTREITVQNYLQAKTLNEYFYKTHILLLGYSFLNDYTLIDILKNCL